MGAVHVKYCFAHLIRAGLMITNDVCRADQAFARATFTATTVGMRGRWRSVSVHVTQQRGILPRVQTQGAVVLKTQLVNAQHSGLVMRSGDDEVPGRKR